MSPEPRFDHDNPEWTEADFARAKPLSAFPELEAARKRKPDRPTGTSRSDPSESQSACPLTRIIHQTGHSGLASVA